MACRSSILGAEVSGVAPGRKLAMVQPNGALMDRERQFRVSEKTLTAGITLASQIDGA